MSTIGEQLAALPAVKVRLERYEQDSAIQKSHSDLAAKAISLYTHVLQGLDGVVPQEKRHEVAATITAGILTGEE
jgi:hypothetical protein